MADFGSEMVVPVARRPRRRYHRETARETLSEAQRGCLVIGLVSLAALGTLDAMLLAQVLLAAVMVFIGTYMCLRVVFILAGRGYRHPPVDEIPDEELPRYTTLHPMYDEANMIPVVVAAMEAMNYPKDRLQCILVLEERDRATVAAARAYPLPDYFTIVETPAVEPYGKPKACNFALGFATGEYVVIYDAEDRPEPDQLRKAVGTFRADRRRETPLGCVQARLVFENEAPVKGALGEVLRDRNGHDVRPTTWSSRLLGNEYTVHFTYVLPGLARLGLPVPLGGTSNHFPLTVLEDLAFDDEEMPEIPGGEATIAAWDPWNVTEDAELGGALAAHGYATELIDSHTDEEAVLTPTAAINQRSRWVKGYLQTSLILLRHPVANMQSLGPVRYAAFLIQVGGTYLSLMLSPLCWALTAAYFVTHSTVIVELFPTPVYYTGVALMVGGNLGLVSVSIAAAIGSRQFATVRYLLLLTPLWWMVLSLATYVATLELLVPSWRPSWNKTAHGVRYMTRRRRLWRFIIGSDRRLQVRPVRVGPAAPALAGSAPLADPRRPGGNDRAIPRHRPAAVRFRPTGAVPVGLAPAGPALATRPHRVPVAATSRVPAPQSSSNSRSASSI